MKKLLLKIAASLVVLLGLLTLNWWKVQQTEKKEADEGAKKKLVALAPEKIRTIELHGEAGAVVLERRTQDGQGAYTDEFTPFDAESALPTAWIVAKPYRDLADPSLVTALMDGVTALESVKTIQEQGADAAAYGLDHPSFQIKLDTGTDTTWIKIGKQNSSGAYYYAQSSTSPRIVLVEKNIEYNAKKDAQEWREKKVLQYKNLAAVDTVRVNYAGKLGRYAFAKAGDDWKMTEPKALPAQGMAVEGIVRTIHTTMMKSIASENKTRDAAKYGLDRPWLEVVTGEKDGDKTVEKRFFVGRVDPKKGALYVARSGSNRVFEVNPTLKEDLTKTLGQFVAKNAFTAKEADLSKVRIRRGSDDVVIVKKDGHWVQEGKDQEFKGMFKVKNFDALDYIGEKVSVAGTPSLEMILTTVGGEQSVKLYPEPKKENYIGWVSRHGLYYRFLKSDVDGILHDLDVLLGLKEEPSHALDHGHDHAEEHGHE